MTQKTFITMILDETGSMCAKRSSVISGTNEYINAHREIEDCFLSLVTFDKSTGKDPVRFVIDAVNINEVKPLTDDDYKPHGMTNLYDAVGSTIAYIEKTTKLADNPIIIVAINTDGEENSSTEYTSAIVSDLIKQKKELGWQFIFMGEDLSKERVSQIATSLNISANMTMSYDSNNRAEVYRGLAKSAVDYTGFVKTAGCQANVDFSEYLKK